jgi:hypothetical protein
MTCQPLPEVHQFRQRVPAWAEKPAPEGRHEKGTDEREGQ